MTTNNGLSISAKLGILFIVIMFALTLGRLVQQETELAERHGENSQLSQQLEEFNDRLDSSNRAILNLSNRLTELGFTPILDEEGNLIEDPSAPQGGGIGIPDENNGGTTVPGSTGPNNRPIPTPNPPSNPNPPSEPSNPSIFIPGFPILPDTEVEIPGTLDLG